MNTLIEPQTPFWVDTQEKNIDDALRMADLLSTGEYLLSPNYYVFIAKKANDEYDPASAVPAIERLSSDESRVDLSNGVMKQLHQRMSDLDRVGATWRWLFADSSSSKNKNVDRLLKHYNVKSDEGLMFLAICQK